MAAEPKSVTSRVRMRARELVAAASAAIWTDSLC
jgi:hypothetical protein